jgi:hypothetical protein
MRGQGQRCMQRCDRKATQRSRPPARTGDAVDGRAQLVRKAVHEAVLDEQQLPQALQDERAVGCVERLLGVSLRRAGGGVGRRACVWAWKAPPRVNTGGGARLAKPCCRAPATVWAARASGPGPHLALLQGHKVLLPQVAGEHDLGHVVSYAPQRVLRGRREQADVREAPDRGEQHPHAKRGRQHHAQQPLRVQVARLGDGAGGGSGPGGWCGKGGSRVGGAAGRRRARGIKAQACPAAPNHRLPPRLTRAS